MVAVLPPELARGYQLRQHLESRDALGGRLESAGDARALDDACMPGGQGRSFRRRRARDRRGVHEGYRGQVAPAEAISIEVGSGAERALEVCVAPGPLAPGARRHAPGEMP